MSKMALTGLVSSLESTIKSLSWKPVGTEWADYYTGTNYSDVAFSSKQQILNELMTTVKPGMVWDLGSNTGVFSRIASSKGIPTISFDVDPAAVEVNYLESCKEAKDPFFLWCWI